MTKSSEKNSKIICQDFVFLLVINLKRGRREYFTLNSYCENVYLKYLVDSIQMRLDLNVCKKHWYARK